MIQMRVMSNAREALIQLYNESWFAGMGVGWWAGNERPLGEEHSGIRNVSSPWQPCGA